MKPNNRDIIPDRYELLDLDAVYTPPFRAFRSAAAGDVAVVKLNGEEHVWKSVVAGETIWCLGKTIKTTGTTVTAPETNITLMF